MTTGRYPTDTYACCLVPHCSSRPVEHWQHKGGSRCGSVWKVRSLTGIGVTQIEGIDEDLGISGVQWNIVLSLFFVPYILLEVPSNALLKRLNRPSVYMGILVTSWGVIMTMHGVVQNWATLLALRILLGVFEAGFFPGAVYLCVRLDNSPRSLKCTDDCRHSGTCLKIWPLVFHGSTASARSLEPSLACLPRELPKWMASVATKAGDGSF